MARTLSGKDAEQLAQQYLKERQLTIIATNYRTRRGEIDIIAKDGNTLIFIEVRLRSNSIFGSAAESVNDRKQQRLIAAAENYLQKYRLTNNVPCRFDVIAISRNNHISSPNRPNYQVEWLQNAFGG